MAYREDYLNPETLAKADELDIYFQSQGQPQYHRAVIRCTPILLAGNR